jgi:nucleoside 2-deoxyribosyltransferase
MKIMVCGSIGHGGIGDIRYFHSLLKKEGFDIIDHISAEGMDYSDTRDFRDKKDFSSKIVNHDLEYVKESDVLVILANRPSFGTAIEMFVAKNSKKPVVVFAKESVPTPWPINFSDYIVTTEEELITLLRQLDTYRRG